LAKYVHKWDDGEYPYLVDGLRLRNKNSIHRVSVRGDDAEEFARRFLAFADPQTECGTDGTLPYKTRMQCSECGYKTARWKGVKVFESSVCPVCAGRVFPQKRYKVTGDLMWCPVMVNERLVYVRGDFYSRFQEVLSQREQIDTTFGGLSYSDLINMFTPPETPAYIIEERLSASSQVVGHFLFAVGALKAALMQHR
jgi:hypothetical protein